METRPIDPLEEKKPTPVPKTGEPVSLVGIASVLGGMALAAGRKLRKDDGK